MSLIEKVFSFGHQVITLAEKTDRLAQSIDKLETTTSNLNDRVIRIESLIEFTQRSYSSKNLPK